MIFFYVGLKYVNNTAMHKRIIIKIFVLVSDAYFIFFALCGCWWYWVVCLTCLLVNLLHNIQNYSSLLLVTLFQDSWYTKSNGEHSIEHCYSTVCPRSLVPFYIGSNYIKWVKTFGTFCYYLIKKPWNINFSVI